MEAKEVVANEVARQKEFGYEPSWEDFVIAGQKAGMRKVVKWINENFRRPFSIEEWQAKLKEWNIK